MVVSPLNLIKLVTEQQFGVEVPQDIMLLQSLFELRRFKLWPDKFQTEVNATITKTNFIFMARVLADLSCYSYFVKIILFVSTSLPSITRM